MIFRIQNVWTYLDGDIQEEIAKEIDEKLSYSVSGAKFAMEGWEEKQRRKLAENAKWKKKQATGRRLTREEEDNIDEYWQTVELQYKWDGKQHFWRSGRIPTGLVMKVLKILKKHSVDYIVNDLRKKPKQELQTKFGGITPFQDQLDAALRAVDKQRGIIQAPTGWGKTEVIALLIDQLKMRTLILIHRETIFIQLQKRLQDRLGVPVGVLGGGYKMPHNITVAMMQTISDPKYKEFIQSFPVVIVDECHHIPAKTMYDIMMSSDSYHRYGFSATPWRDDGAEMYIEAALGRFIVKITPSSLISIGRLAKPYIYFVHNPMIPQYEKLSWQKQYVKCIVENEYRNRMAVMSAYMMWKNKRTCLIAVTQIRHGKILLGMLQSMYPKLNCRFIKGEDESQEKQKVLKQLNERQLDVVIATSVFGEGIDVPTLDCIINAKGQESKVDVYQLIGRALRKTKTKSSAFFIDFMDNEKYTKVHAQTRMKVLQEEEEFEVRSVRTITDLEKQLDRQKILEESL